jgi:hypothetical protein
MFTKNGRQQLCSGLVVTRDYRGIQRVLWEGLVHLYGLRGPAILRAKNDIYSELVVDSGDVNGDRAVDGEDSSSSTLAVLMVTLRALKQMKVLELRRQEQEATEHQSTTQQNARKRKQPSADVRSLETPPLAQTQRSLTPALKDTLVDVSATPRASPLASAPAPLLQTPLASAPAPLLQTPAQVQPPPAPSYTLAPSHPAPFPFRFGKQMPPSRHGPGPLTKRTKTRKELLESKGDT